MGNRNILIFDAGATKTEVALSGTTPCRVIVGGINPAVMPAEDIRNILFSVKEQLPEGDVAAIYYYGAGCANPQLCKCVADELRNVWNCVEVEVHSDIVGAARALHQDRAGIACILGTGSNSALYDGGKIIRNVAPLGYILGDEGSGSAIGKRLAGDVFKGLAPKDVADRFLLNTGISKDVLIEKVYRGTAPNKFLASFCRFVGENIEHPYLRNLVKEMFESFLDRNIAVYPESKDLELGFVGSVAFHFKDILQDACVGRGYKCGAIIKQPMENLISYHER